MHLNFNVDGLSTTFFWHHLDYSQSFTIFRSTVMRWLTFVTLTFIYRTELFKLLQTFPNNVF